MLHLFILLAFGAGYFMVISLFSCINKMLCRGNSRIVGNIKVKTIMEILRIIVFAWARDFGELVIFLLPSNAKNKVMANLQIAGHPRGLDVFEYLGLTFFLCIGLSLMFLLIWEPVLSVFMGFIIAIIFSNFSLIEQGVKRQKLISRELPFTIDLLAICVGAGLGFTSGLTKVIQKGKRGPLRDELHRMLYEMKMGKSRNKALGDLSERVNVSDVNSFVSTLIMADRFGTSIGSILRVLAKQIRLKRMQRAESRAYKAPVKMVFPLVFFIFPTILIMLLGPVILINFFPG